MLCLLSPAQCRRSRRFRESAVVFESNWWGATDGPSGSGSCSGDSVSADVDYDPWLTSPLAICNTAPVASDAAFTVAEDAPVGTTVGTVAAVDDGEHRQPEAPG
jgi:hypothetical protein